VLGNGREMPIALRRRGLGGAGRGAAVSL
jgi:hypothetical protein